MLNGAPICVHHTQFCANFRYRQRATFFAYLRTLHTLELRRLSVRFSRRVLLAVSCAFQDRRYIRMALSWLQQVIDLLANEFASLYQSLN